MNIEDAKKQNVYEQILKVACGRLEQAIPGSEGTLTHLPLGEVLNLLFLLRGELGSIGDFMTTFRALRATVGDDLIWAEPSKSRTVVVPDVIH
jgi:hypothetical protein